MTTREEVLSWATYLEGTGQHKAAALLRSLLAERDEAIKHGKDIERAIADPENQPSQYGTVPMAWYYEAIEYADAAISYIEETNTDHSDYLPGFVADFQKWVEGRK